VASAIKNKTLTSSEPKKVLVQLDLSQKNLRDWFVYFLSYAREHTNWIVRRTPLIYRHSMTAEEMISSLHNWKPDGFVVNYGDFPHHIYKMGIPILAGANVRGTPSDVNRIVDDSETVSRLAAEHLISHGFKRFAYCGFDIAWSHSRRDCFSRIIKKAGFELSIFDSPVKPQDMDAMIHWLKSLKPPVALLACNDDRAEEVITACQTIGMKIPKDIAVLGIDNDPLICETTFPQLSSIAFNLKETSWRAARTLERLMNGIDIKRKKIFTFPTHVVTRQSTDTMSVNDPLVAKAMSYIHSHHSVLIQVKDVAAEVKISSSELRKRFNKALNHSIQYEIVRSRVNYISKLLIETDFPVYEIAAQLGYPPEGKYIIRFFKKVTGMTPHEYRRHYRKHFTE
jgi:LacI family transcriptional regulator